MSNLSTIRSINILLLCVCFTTSIFGQSAFKEINDVSIAETGLRFLNPINYKLVKIDQSRLQAQLTQAPVRFSGVENKDATIELPMPDGSKKQFLLFESPVMHPDLQARYPEIRTYTGVGIDDPTALLKCDWTPHGFHAMILSGKHNSVAIDPYQMGDTEHYYVYFKKDARRVDGFPNMECAVEGQEAVKIEFNKNEVSGTTETSAGDCDLRKYRLALSCTGEYANFHGGTVPLVLAAMNTSMNRVNGVYERDMAVTMELIPNNDQLVFLNASSDPFTNGSGGTMLGQNQTTITNTIGAANYDIGHVFSTGGGGIAGLGVVCRNNNKANGVTGQGAPVGDFFDIDYVAHEMGHQFGANHTQYNNCNKNGSTAMEPGSASTIMGYAGICNPNVQNNSDDYFHAISVQEISNYITTGSGNTCPVKTVTGNNPPEVTVGENAFIPISTPFALTANASDADGDAMTYCWEQMDASGSATQPPVAANTQGPMFRSLDPTDSPTRYFPTLLNVITGSNNQWEVLPSANRSLNFRVTVRDNYQGAGCTDEDNITLQSTTQAGPFVVSTPNTNILWTVGETQPVEWDVANTDSAPVNCSAVRILLSTDGGFTYPFVLADSVANTGSAMITVPDAVTTSARVMVQANGNYFYDISNQNFRIEQPVVPTFLMNVATTTDNVCAGASADYDLSFTALLNYSDDVQLAVSGLPTGSMASFSDNPASPMGTSTLTISGLTPAMAGTYSLSVTATSGSIVRTENLELEVFPGAPTAQLTNADPATASVGVATLPYFTWLAVPFATSYEIELASNPSFDASVIIVSTSSTAPNYQVAAPLELGSVYYWRVRSLNLCGNGAWSVPASFQVGSEDCGNVFSSTTAVSIDENTVNTVTSTIDVANTSSIQKLTVSMDIDHSWVGDLIASLTGPDGTEVSLFHQPGLTGTPGGGNFGCGGNDIVVTLDDAASATAADLEDACDNNPAISGTFQPIDMLSAFSGKSIEGVWTLTVTDNYDEDGGQINAWSLDACFPVSFATATIASNNGITVTRDDSELINTASLNAQYNGTAAAVQYLITSLPTSGTLQLSGATLGVGGIFTQADIDGNAIAYFHGGDAATMDMFTFDLLESSDNSWLPGQVFEITILQNTLSAQASVDTEIACANASTGSITATTSGGTMPFTYSLNNTGIFQNSNVFSGLNAGSYSIIVKDALGFSFTTNTVDLNNPTAIQAGAMATNDVITVTASGGTGTLQYSLDGGAFQMNSTFTGLANGSYIITVMDENGCTKDVSAIVAVNSLVVNLDLLSSITCFGENDGALVVNVGGGQGPYMYSLNGAAAVTTNAFDNLSPGTYSVQVSDSQGFMTTTNDIIITEPSPISAQATANLNVATVIATGGTGTLQYSLDGMTYSNNNVFQGLDNGDYSIVVRDENGCFAFTSVTISVAALTGTGTVSSVITCNSSSDGEVTLSTSGGVPPYRYRLGASGFQNSPTFTGLSAGTYTARIRDAQGTIVNFTVKIDEPTAVSATADVLGNDVTLSALGGTGTFMYQISGGTAQNSPVFSDLTNGDYDFIVTDVNGCIGTVSATVNLTAVSISSTPTAVSCFGASDGSIEVVGMGGLSPYSYQLDGGGFQSTGLFGNLLPGTYIVEIMDAEGQTDMETVIIEEPTAIAATAAAFGNTVTVDAMGGTPPYMYQIGISAPQSSNEFSNLAAGTYTVKVLDANGCEGQAMVTVMANNLTLELTDLSNSTCNNSNDGAAFICISDGTAPFIISVTPNNIGSVFQDAGTCDGNIVIDGLHAEMYSVVITDAAGFSQTIEFTPTEPDPIVVTYEILGGNNINVMATGGTGSYMYSLDQGSSPQASNMFNSLPDGSYDIWVEDANLCVGTLNNVIINTVKTVEPSTEWQVSVSPNPSTGIFYVNAQNGLEHALAGRVLDLTGRQLLRFEMPANQGKIRQEIDMTNLPDGMYLLQLTDGNNTGVIRLMQAK